MRGQTLRLGALLGQLSTRWMTRSRHVRTPPAASSFGFVVATHGNCQRTLRFDFAPVPPDEVIGHILRGQAHRERVEQLLGEPTHVRCDGCKGPDVEYVFESDGKPGPFALMFNYFDHGRVMSISAHSPPVRARRGSPR